MSRNVMVDIEALGTVPGSVVMSIGACYFGKKWSDNSFGNDNLFKMNIEVFDSLMYGLKVSKAWLEHKG